MIIGIVGKKQSGKNTVAQFAHEYLCPEYYKKLKKFRERKNNREIFWGDPSWEFKSFAEPIKKFASKILNIPKEDFEKEEVKNSYLGSEWNLWQVDEKNWENTYFNSQTEAINDYLQSHSGNYGIPLEEIDFDILPIKEVSITVRQFLQWFGTNACRNNIHSNIWVNALMNKYKPTDKWIITDVRFPNEIKAIKEKNGIIIRVIRPNQVKIDTHISETALEEIQFSNIIINDGTLADLNLKVKNLLNSLNIKNNIH